MYSTLNTEVLSTEEVLRIIADFNSRGIREHRKQPQRKNKTPSMQSEKLVIGSMDVSALYPNCKVAQTMKAIEEACQKSKIEYTEVDNWFLAKFVSVLTRGDCGKHLNRFLQIPKQRTTLNSFMKRQSETQFLGPPRNTGETCPMIT